MVAEFQQKEISLHALDFGGMPLNTSTAMGQFIVTLRAALAELERETIRERTIEAMEERKRKGQLLGQVPFGHRLEDNKVVKEPWYESAMADITTLRQQGESYRTIASYISADHAPVSHHTIQKLIKENTYE
jgi:DNA invertase Pin-like site-specific DNA recombinase